MRKQSTINNQQSRISILFFALFFLILTMPGASTAQESPLCKLTIYVDNYPLNYFAERIAGEYATVFFPAPPDVDPAYWHPDTKTIAAYQQADLILLNGANYAKWVSAATLTQSKVVDTSKGFENQYITSDEAVTHSHGPDGKHALEGLSFTTWIDFDLAAKQAQAIADALSKKMPDGADTFKTNIELLNKDLLDIDSAIKAVADKASPDNPQAATVMGDEDFAGIVRKKTRPPLMVSHPVYDYFARRYDLNIKSVHWEPDEMPTEEQWMELQTILKDHPAKSMIWEGPPLQATVDRLQTMGVNSVVFDPCGNVPEEGNFLSVMQQNVKNIEVAYEK